MTGKRLNIKYVCEDIEGVTKFNNSYKGNNIY